MERAENFVSVVIPCFNAERFLKMTIRSVLNQTYQNLQIIVVDDKSTDDSVSIVRQLMSEDARIELIETQQNYGAPAGPRNIGVRAAKGKWIAFLDSDDIWHPKKLEHQISVLASTGAKFCCTSMMDFQLEDSLEFTSPEFLRIEKIGFWKQMFKMRTPTSSVVVDKALVLRHPFNEDMKYKAQEDFDCYLRCLEEIGFGMKILHPFVGYRVAPHQISGNKLWMVRGHHYVLGKYRFRSGRQLGHAAWIFTVSHIFLSIYYRVFKKML